MATKDEITKEIRALDIEITGKNKRRGELSEKLIATQKQIESLTSAISLATVENKDTTKEKGQLINLKTEADSIEGAISLLDKQLEDLKQTHRDMKRAAARMDFDAVFFRYTSKTKSAVDLLQQLGDTLKELEELRKEISLVGAHEGVTLEHANDDQRLIMQIVDAFNSPLTGASIPGFLKNLYISYPRAIEYMQKNGGKG